MDDTLPARIDLQLVTPDRQVARESVSAVTLPGQAGCLGILPGHAPLLTELVAGECAYTSEGEVHHLALNLGFAEVLPDRVIILSQTAERAEEIDVERAERARQRAQERLKKFTDPQIDMERARAALVRALARLQVAARSR